MSAAMRRLLCLGTLTLALGAAAAPAQAAPGDPLFTFVPTTATVPKVAPVGYLIGPCGLGVDSSGRFYVSDYYHHTVDLFAPGSAPAFNPPATYGGQLTNVDPLDGPCGLALDSANRLYVNSFDRNLARFNAFPGFGAATILAGAGVDATHPTGVAVDPTTDSAYLNARTYISGYDKSGAQLTNGADPLQIGLGSLGEGYGLALDAAGRLYAADAADDTVKIYDPALSLTTPVKTITGPPGGFSSLRHSALAVDRQSGVLYVIDNLQPENTERPSAQVDVFDPNAISPYLGVLKYKIVDALPAGIAVDNSGGASQGRLYVTSGNTNQAGVYAYAPGSQIASSQPPIISVTVKATGSGAGAIGSDLGELECSGECTAQIRSGATVTLTVTPGPGSTFAGWSGGDCEGLGECAVEMDEARTVGAEFRAGPESSGPLAASPPPPALPAGAVGSPALAPTVQRHAHRQRARHRRRSAHRRHRGHHAKPRHHHRAHRRSSSQPGKSR